MNFPRVSVIVLAILALQLSHQAMAQFSWDGDCSTLWYDCCLQGDQYENNWSTAGNPTACPPLPGPTDTVSLSGLVDSGGAQINIAGMFQSGMFLCYAQTLSILDGDIFTSGSPLEPSTFQLNGIINLHDGATIDVGSFSTLDFRSGEIRSFGTPGHKVVIGGFGALTKTAEPAALTRLSVPFDNQGLISVPVGTLTIEAGGSSTGTIEALGDATINFSGGTFDLAGEVRGDGLVRFDGGIITIVTDDYHPTNTLMAGGASTVNFESDNSIENLTLNAGRIGGAADVSIDDFVWHGGQMLAGGTVSIQDTALFQGTQDLYRDMELLGVSLLPGAWLRMEGAEIRNYGDLELQGNTTIDQFGSTPNAGIKNFASLRKTGGGITQINVILSNVGGGQGDGDGMIEVASGELRLNGAMATTGPITVAAGATLSMWSGQQFVFPSGSITGEGTVRFMSGFAQPDVLEGVYDIPITEMWGGTVQFESDATTATLYMVDATLAGDGDFTVTGELNFAWGASYMLGAGMTKALGPVRMTHNGYLQRVLEIDNVKTSGGSGTPAGGMLFIPANSNGELRGIGTIDGNVSDNSGIEPGLPDQSPPIGSLNITGSFWQYSNPPGVLKIDLEGAAHDELNVGGTAHLSGTLSVTGSPAGGQSYTILTAQNIVGTFAQLNLPPGMTVSYTPTSVILQAAPGPPCPADIVVDGIVNVDDLLALLAAWGPCDAKQSCAADIAPPPPASGDGIVNVDDLLALLASWGPCP